MKSELLFLCNFIQKLIVMIPTRYFYPSPGFSIYWEKGNGRDLAKHMIGAFPTNEAIEKQIPLLFQVDELADQVIREVYQKVGFKLADTWINDLLDQKQIPDAPSCLHEIIYQTLTKPTWLNEELVEKGSALCRRSGTKGLMVLRNYCLMGGYESAAINKPLVFTGALKKGAAKRLTETTEFWVQVIGEKALKTPQNGLKACLKIRLMHAYARVSILDDGKWQANQWGAPLNQWDMIATNLGFSIIFLDGLRKLGMHVTSQEAKGIFHLWKYIGYLLGIPYDLLPNDESEAIKAIYSWTITQAPADNDTIALAHALTREPLDGPFPKASWQKQLVYKTHIGYNRFFLGNTSCETMQLPQTIFRYGPILEKYVTKLGELFAHLNTSMYQRKVHLNRQKQLKIVNQYLASHNRKLISEK